MKKLLFSLIPLLLLVSVTQGAIPSVLPTTDETHYRGAQDFSFDLGLDGNLNGRLEFAVYTENQFGFCIFYSKGFKFSLPVKFNIISVNRSISS